MPCLTLTLRSISTPTNISKVKYTYAFCWHLNRLLALRLSALCDRAGIFPILAEGMWSMWIKASPQTELFYFTYASSRFRL